MTDEKKIIIHTEGGPVINGGTFTNVEFVTHKYVVMNDRVRTVPYEEVEDAEEKHPETPQKEPSLVSCIEKLMNEKDEKGDYLVNKGNHWIAIFRIIVDKHLGASNTDYLGFCRLMKELKPEGFRIPLKQDNLKRIANGVFSNPFDKWKYDPIYNPTRKPYDEMVDVARRFKEILEENGL